MSYNCADAIFVSLSVAQSEAAVQQLNAKVRPDPVEHTSDIQAEEGSESQVEQEEQTEQQTQGGGEVEAKMSVDDNADKAQQPGVDEQDNEGEDRETSDCESSECESELDTEEDTQPAEPHFLNLDPKECHKR